MALHIDIDNKKLVYRSRVFLLCDSLGCISNHSISSLLTYHSSWLSLNIGFTLSVATCFGVIPDKYSPTCFGTGYLFCALCFEFLTGYFGASNMSIFMIFFCL